MKAAVIHKYSKDLSGFSIEKLNKPEISKSQDVLIKVVSSSLNPVDLKNLSGESKVLLPEKRNVQFCPLVTHSNKKDMQELASFVNQGLRAKVGKTFQLEQLQEAVSKVKSGKVAGKALIKMS